MMAKMTGGEALAQTLKAAGVEYIFGISVGSQAPFTLGAMRLGIRIVTVRDENRVLHCRRRIYARSRMLPAIKKLTLANGGGSIYAIRPQRPLDGPSCRRQASPHRPAAVA